MVPGQNVDLTFHEATYPNASGGPVISTMTLVSQTVDGYVSAMGTSGTFTTYTVWLATNDLFPSLAFQIGQNNLLANPRVVVVYVDGEAQTLNSLPVTVGSVMRFNGLVFNDNGTLRMVCGQVNDGPAQ